MDTPADKLKYIEMARRVSRALFEFIFTFENKKGEVLNYQMFHADGFKYSAREFYAAVEQKLAERKIPGMEISRVKFAEGGLLSDQRLYLRLMRERLCIETCAAPFGDIFFFSYRTVYVPALLRLWHIVVALGFFGVTFHYLSKPLGQNFAAIGTVALAFALVAVLRNASTGGYSDLDTILLKIPVVSTIYEYWFREETYYREDTRNLYVQLLPQFIQEIANQVCATEGVKLVPYLQPVAPVADLKRPLSPAPEPPKK